jgi:hypothetical protein
MTVSFLGLVFALAVLAGSGRSGGDAGRADDLDAVAGGEGGDLCRVGGAVRWRWQGQGPGLLGAGPLKASNPPGSVTSKKLAPSGE